MFRHRAPHFGERQVFELTDALAGDVEATADFLQRELIPAIETAHAIAGVVDLAAELGPESIILINLSGRGDKDVETAARWFGLLDGAKPGVV